MNVRWLAVGIVFVAAALGAEEASESDSEKVLPPEISSKTDEAIRKACDWLAKQQGRGGELKSQFSVAATGLAGMAWLASGSTPHEGKYAENIRKALDYLIKAQAKGGYITEGGAYGASGMYGHGYATQFLAQVYGMVRDPDLGAKIHGALSNAVRLIEGAQNSFGGWNSGPDANAGDDGSGAVAIMQITALRAAESCGVSVHKKVVDKAKKYLLEMTNNEGWYAYNWHARASGRGSCATTGAGMYMIGAMGMQDHAKYAKGIKNLMDSCPFGRGAANRNMGLAWSFYAYTCFYSSLAIFQHGGEEWRKWYPGMINDLLSKQHPDGSWDDPYGGVFTALSVMCLELPYRYLPMFQEGGSGLEGR